MNSDPGSHTKPKRFVRKYPIRIVTWEKHEDVRQSLVESAWRYRRAAEAVRSCPNHVFFENTVRSLHKKSHDPAFVEVGEALRELNELTRKSVQDDGIHLDLVLHATNSIINPHPEELERLEKNLAMARKKTLARELEESRWKRLNR